MCIKTRGRAGKEVNFMKVLLVDDDKHFWRFLTIAPEIAGQEVEEATSCVEAPEILQK